MKTANTVSATSRHYAAIKEIIIIIMIIIIISYYTKPAFILMLLGFVRNAGDIVFLEKRGDVLQFSFNLSGNWRRFS